MKRSIHHLDAGLERFSFLSNEWKLGSRRESARENSWLLLLGSPNYVTAQLPGYYVHRKPHPNASTEVLLENSEDNLHVRVEGFLISKSKV